MGERGVLPSSRNQTIRELLEDAASYKAFAGRPLILAAIDQLDNANYQRRDGFPSTRYALIRDPMHPHDDPRSVETTPSQSECEHLGEYTCLRCGIALDPGVGAEHAPKEHP